jgi:hypothetical protein
MPARPGRGVRPGASLLPGRKETRNRYLGVRGTFGDLWRRGEKCPPERAAAGVVLALRLASCARCLPGSSGRSLARPSTHASLRRVFVDRTAHLARSASRCTIPARCAPPGAATSGVAIGVVVGWVVVGWVVVGWAARRAPRRERFGPQAGAEASMAFWRAISWRWSVVHSAWVRARASASGSHTRSPAR